MKRFITLGVAAVISTSIVTSAWAIDFRGRIKKIDTEKNVVSLTNGLDLYYDDTVDEASMKEGQYIRADCKKIKGQYRIRKIKTISD